MNRVVVGSVAFVLSALSAILPAAAQTSYVCEIAGGAEEFNGYVNEFVPRGVFYMGKGPTQGAALVAARQICASNEGNPARCKERIDACWGTNATYEARIGAVMGIGTPPKPGEYICDMRGLDASGQGNSLVTGEYFTETGPDYDGIKRRLQQKCQGRACLPLRCTRKPLPQPQPVRAQNNPGPTTGNPTGGGPVSPGMFNAQNQNRGGLSRGTPIDPVLKAQCDLRADNVHRIFAEYKQMGCKSAQLFPPDRSKISGECMMASFNRKPIPDPQASDYRRRMDTSCKTKAPGVFGAIAAPGNQYRHPVCSSFSSHVGQWQAKARAQGCNLAPLPENLARTPKLWYEWCMTNSEAEFRSRSPQALGFKGVAEKHCSAQLRRPVRL